MSKRRKPGRPRSPLKYEDAPEILTSTMASWFVGVSSPTLKKMAEEGTLEKDRDWFKVGTHYRFVTRRLAEKFHIGGKAG